MREQANRHQLSIKQANFFATPIKPPTLLMLAMECRTVLELKSFFMYLNFLKTAPAGDGQPIVVFPGFLTGDSTTMVLRWYLNNMGYNAYGWNMGLNTGHGNRTEERLGRLVLNLYKKHGTKVSLIGHSLGGIFAREIARWRPEIVKSVITTGSGFAHPPDGCSVKTIYEKVSGTSIKEMEQIMLDRKMWEPPPVPSTAMHSRTDGIISPECCKEQEAPTTENIEIIGSHHGMLHNPHAVWIIADRLAQPEGKWQPYIETFPPNPRYSKGFIQSIRSRLLSTQIENLIRKISKGGF